MQDRDKTKSQLIAEVAELRQQLAALAAAEARRNQVEEALRESEEQFQATFEQDAVGIAHVGMDGTWLWFNRRFCHISGYTPEELSGCKFKEIIHLDDLDTDQRNFRAVLMGEIRTYSIEKRAIRKDGSDVWIKRTVSLVRAPSGQPKYFISVIEDISRCKRAEAELRKSRDELQAVLDGVDEGILVRDSTGRLSYVNEASVRMLGFPSASALLATPPAEILQKFEILDELGHPFPLDQLPAQAALQGVQGPEVVLCLRRLASREERWARVKATPVLDEQGQIQCVVNIFSDITQRKRAEEERAKADALRQADQIKSQFLANVSHELRTPLHHIKGYASTLLHRGMYFDKQTTQEYLQIISGESDKLTRLIDDLLNTSQIESGTLFLDIDSVHVDELLRSAVQRWQDAESHHFEIIIPDKVPPIPADAHRIQQVLDNLLANVIRHTPENTRTTVSAHVRREEVLVSVSDTGPGIDMEHIPFLFDRFYQARPQTHHRGGNGLGLYICKGIIEQHGGRIWIEMTPGSGTTFRFSLPRRRKVSTSRITQSYQVSVPHANSDPSSLEGPVGSE